jgi:hypothetical protein
VRNAALARVFEARACLQLGELDAACAGLSATATMSRGNTSLRLASAIAAVRSDMTAWQGSAHIADLDEQLRASRATA